jgi:hypothetical protein
MLMLLGFNPEYSTRSRCPPYQHNWVTGWRGIVLQPWLIVLCSIANFDILLLCRVKGTLVSVEEQTLELYV